MPKRRWEGLPWDIEMFGPKFKPFCHGANKEFLFWIPKNFGGTKIWDGYLLASIQLPDGSFSSFRCKGLQPAVCHN